MNTIAEGLTGLRQSISQAAQSAGRDPGSISLVLVTKQVTPERILEAYQAGHRDFGENRVQELTEKAGKLPRDIRWHMIGHLQTNKAKDVVGLASQIHSVDSLRLAETLDRSAEKKGIERLSVLMEVNTSGEKSKFGITAEEAESVAEKCGSFKRLCFQGLMTVGPFVEDQKQIRKAFRTLREILERLKAHHPEHPWQHLSMGMSDDYPMAIEEGATILRIGRAVFGERKIETNV